ncbi:DUF5856 family protein [Microvirga alba]|uniref:Uncharacterized protein n=1 Tax=Microvirga alba TaxID=2791025 RepID=A0A931FUG1_9HYPH|nr:DUF5856 family protein [Microvirga alba]MBF9235581.1 hypothetical protein [Microvirga alba]
MPIMENLIAHLFLARELAHRAHLQTRSFAQHVALGDFYGAIGDRADAIAEAYQGRFGVLLSVPMLTGNPDAPIIDTLRAHVEWISSQRYVAVSRDETAIQNLIDEAVGAYLSTIYKLQFLA